MPIKDQLLDILVCPKCKGTVSSVEDGRAMLCPSCHLKYPVRNGVPIMRIEEAKSLRPGAGASSSSSPGACPEMKFSIVDGPNKGMVFNLEMKTCKVVGRSLSDPNKTSMFNVDLTLSLDEGTRGVVQKYLTKQFKNGNRKPSDGALGSFVRTFDIILDDSSVSRLHAMFFYDEIGVGVLDLVSKNGTFVNGREVESHLLQKGDTVEIGESRIVFEG